MEKAATIFENSPFEIPEIREAQVSRQRNIYVGAKMAQRIRHWLKAEFKPVFDMEASASMWDKEVEVKAAACGLEVEEYKGRLKFLMGRPLCKLGIVLMRIENDFLENYWVNMKKAEGMARDAKDYKAIVMIEREKQLGVKRLIETGRMINPGVYERGNKKRRKDMKGKVIEIVPPEGKGETQRS